jgi:pyruvate dehydrogenase E2 component (dihydrolipoamide acetyltransferase)
MARLLAMPAVAAASGSAALQDWLVTVGQSFAAGEVLAVIETEKAVVDLEAETDGVLLQLLAGPGATVDVGDPIAILGDPGETADAATDLLATVRPGSAAPPVRVFMSPLARRLARDAGLGIADLHGSGPGGRIVRRDVETAIAATRASAAPPVTAPSTSPAPTSPVPAAPEPAAPALVAPSPTAAFVDEPHSRMRRAIAARLTMSKQTIPHFSLTGVCRVDALLALRAQINELAPVTISVNDLVVKAAARAHVAVPQMNVIWTDDAVRRFHAVDLAVAVATDGGLVTPVLRGVDRMSISELAATTRELAGRAKASQLKQAELEGGSLTVTNLGMFGTQSFTAIINPPQAAILAVGAAIRTPVVVEDRVEVGTVMTVTLSVDHRPVDGVVAAAWMQAFVRLVEAPLQLLV